MISHVEAPERDCPLCDSGSCPGNCATCPTCGGGGELQQCANDGSHGCSHVNDRAWTCRDCDGTGAEQVCPDPSCSCRGTEQHS